MIINGELGNIWQESHAVSWWTDYEKRRTTQASIAGAPADIRTDDPLGISTRQANGLQTFLSPPLATCHVSPPPVATALSCSVTFYTKRFVTSYWSRQQAQDFIIYGLFTETYER
jgi:hypothetical protein